MSAKEPESNDFMNLVIAGGIGVVTLGIFILCVCLRSDNKKEKDKQGIKPEEKVEEIKDIKPREENNIQDKKDEDNKEEEKIKTNKKKKNKNKNKNKDKKINNEEKKNLDFVIDDDRDGEWETVGDKKENSQAKGNFEEEKKKTEKYYNDYLDKF